MAEAVCSVAGGHSVADDQIKFGYAVTGLIHPRKIWKNVGAQPGDLLLLTKPLGSKVILYRLEERNRRGSLGKRRDGDYGDSESTRRGSALRS